MGGGGGGSIKGQMGLGVKRANGRGGGSGAVGREGVGGGLRGGGGYGCCANMRLLDGLHNSRPLPPSFLRYFLFVLFFVLFF